MTANFHTPPYPFEHRTSEADMVAYIEAVDQDNVRALFRRWDEEESQLEKLKRQEERALAERQTLNDTLKKLIENSNAMKNASGISTKTWMTKSEAAKYLGVSERTIDRKRETGALRVNLVEGTNTFRFNKDDLDDLMS